MEYRIVELLKEIKGLLVGKEKTDKWIDIKEASEYCSVSPTTLRRNVDSGKLNASRVRFRAMAQWLIITHYIVPLKDSKEWVQMVVSILLSAHIIKILNQVSQ